MLGALYPAPLAEALDHQHRVTLAATASKRRNQSVQIPWRAARARFAPSRTSRPPIQHVRAGGLGVVAWSMRGALHPTPLAETLLHRHRARSAAMASKYHGYTVKFRSARQPHASPRGEPADCPQSTCALADLASVSSRPTRDALHPTPLAEALLHRYHAGSAAAASTRRNQQLRIPWRAAHARFAPWEISRPATEHMHAGGLGVVVFAANAGHAPSHAVGRGSSSPIPRRVAGCGFEAL